MKKMHRVLSVFLAVLTLAGLLAVLPAKAEAAGISAPVATVSNDAATGKVKLTWVAVEGAVNYEIYRAIGKSGTYSRRITVTETAYTDVEAEAGKTYYYKVRAFAADGTYAESKAVSRTCDLPRPVTKVSNVASSGAPKVTWEAVAGAKEYQVYRATSKSGTYSLMKTTTKTSYTNTSAEAGTTYYYKVKAIAEISSANSAYSSVKSRTCDLPRPVVTVSNVESSGAPKVTWETVEGAKEYQVYRATSKDGTYTLMKTITKTSYTNTSAKLDKTYYYKIKAIAEKSSANSAYSSVQSCTRDLAQPKVSITLTSSGYPKVTWEAVEGAIEYQAYRATSRNGTYKLMKTTTKTSYTNTSATSGQTYYYKVRAIYSNSEANSAYSEILSIRAGGAATSDLRYVALPSVYIYKSASSSSSSVKLPYMTELKLGKAASSGSSWYEVYYEGKLYYIYLPAGSDKLTTVQSTLDYTSDNPYQQEVIDLAVTIYKEWKTDYVSNESGVVHSDGTVGFDCSGFVGYVINTVMQRHVPAYRLSPGLVYLYETYDIYNTGLRGEFKAIDVELEDIQPGDVIFFYDHNTITKLNHCALYMGNNEFLHSTSTWDGVCLMPLTDSFADRFMCVKRFIPEPEDVKPANATWYAKSGCSVYADTRCKEKSGFSLTRGEAVTVLYTRATDSNGVAYIRTSSGKYGFVWTSNLSKTK